MTKALAATAVEVGNGRSIREANVEAFLDAAERLLVREGVAGISTRQLAREAGQNHGLVHYYFGSVDELLLQAWSGSRAGSLTASGRCTEPTRPSPRSGAPRSATSRRISRRGYPNVWAELEALAWDRPELRRAAARPSATGGAHCCATRLPMRLRSTASTAPRFSAEAWAALVMQFNKGLLFERLLGFDRGHAELLAAIDGWLASLEEGKT